MGEILKQKSKALEKSMNVLQQMNMELSDRVNATELAKNQIQRKLADTMSRMKSSFTASPNAAASPERPREASPKMQFPVMNLREKMTGVSAGMKGMADRFDAMFVSSRPTPQQQQQQKHPQQRIQRAQTEYLHNSSGPRQRGSSTKS